MFKVKYQLPDGSLKESLCPDFRIEKLFPGFKAYPTCGFVFSKTVVNEHGIVIGWMPVEREF